MTRGALGACVLARTHTHTHTHTHTDTHTHARTHARTHTHTHRHARTHAHTHTHTHPHELTHTHTGYYNQRRISDTEIRKQANTTAKQSTDQPECDLHLSTNQKYKPKKHSDIRNLDDKKNTRCYNTFHYSTQVTGDLGAPK